MIATSLTGANHHDDSGPPTNRDILDLFDAAMYHGGHLLVSGRGQKTDGLLALQECRTISHWTEKPQPVRGHMISYIVTQRWKHPISNHTISYIVTQEKDKQRNNLLEHFVAQRRFGLVSYACSNTYYRIRDCSTYLYVS